MSQIPWTIEETIERSREIEEARAELKQLAERQGVQPVADPSELRGSPAPADEGNDNVDELLRMLREWRNEDLAMGG